MITSNEYVSYDTFNDRQSIYQWINNHQSIFSNRQDDYKTVINHQCDYKEKHKYVYGKKEGKKVYNTIYAHFLEIMIPNNMDDNQKHEFIKKYMSALHPCYRSKNFLYCYKFNSKGEGTYIEVMCFTRMYFKRKQHKTVRYTRDYYFNPFTKKISTADDKDAILKHRKGQAKVDNKGLVIKEDYYVSPSEKLIFKYKSFTRLRKRLIKQIQYVKLLITRDYWKQQTKFFSRITIKRSDWKNKDKLTSKNQMIIRLNSIINDMQLALYQSKAWYDLEHSFYKLIHKMNSTIYLTKWKDSLSGKFVYLGTKQSLTSFNDNLTLFEEYLNSILKEWWINEMIDESIYSFFEEIKKC